MEATCSDSKMGRLRYQIAFQKEQTERYKREAALAQARQVTSEAMTFALEQEYKAEVYETMSR